MAPKSYLSLQELDVLLWRVYSLEIYDYKKNFPLQNYQCDRNNLMKVVLGYSASSNRSNRKKYWLYCGLYKFSNKILILDWTLTDYDPWKNGTKSRSIPPEQTSMVRTTYFYYSYLFIYLKLSYLIKLILCVTLI